MSSNDLGPGRKSRPKWYEFRSTPSFKKRLLEIRDGVKIYAVDGAYVQTYLDRDEEGFMHRGNHWTFPNMIPPDEIWLDEANNEIEYWLEHEVVKRKLLSEGVNFSEAKRQAIELELHTRGLKEAPVYDESKKRATHESLPKEVYLRRLTKFETLGGPQVWLVDAKSVREKVHFDFAFGGHEFVYQFVPEGEIWVGDDGPKSEWRYTIDHEIRERNLMANGMDYSMAHEKHVMPMERWDRFDDAGIIGFLRSVIPHRAVRLFRVERNSEDRSVKVLFNIHLYQFLATKPMWIQALLLYGTGLAFLIMVRAWFSGGFRLQGLLPSRWGTGISWDDIGGWLAAPRAPPPLMKDVPEPEFLGQADDISIWGFHVLGFDKLMPKQRIFAYHLRQAADAGRDIFYDQLHPDALAVKQILGQILTHSTGINPALLESLNRYAVRFWVMNGFYHSGTMRKFVPDFTFDEWASMAMTARSNGAGLGVTSDVELKKKLKALKKTMFDSHHEPKLVNREATDKVQGSAVNLHGRGVTEEDVASFGQTSKTSRIEKMDDGRVLERPFRELYAHQFAEIRYHLTEALEFAEFRQKGVLRKLIAAFEQDADEETFREYLKEWIQLDPKIDIDLGFMETYFDPLGRKGVFEGAVVMRDEAGSALMKGLSELTPLLLKDAPWPSNYKLPEVIIPRGFSVYPLSLTGFAGPSPFSAWSMPNDREVEEKHGQKVWILPEVNLFQFRKKYKTPELLREFSWNPDREMDLHNRWGADSYFLLTALHEVVGHLPIQMDSFLGSIEPEEALGDYYDTLEEARAELGSLWMIAHPLLAEKGYVRDPGVVEDAYRTFVRNDLIRLLYTGEEERLQGDHDRSEHMIVSYLLEKGYGVTVKERDGKIFLDVDDIDAFRHGVGELWAELTRIKSEGDKQAAETLVERYAVQIRPERREDVRRRRPPGVPLTSLVAAVLPRLVPVYDEEGNLQDARLEKVKRYEEQMIADFLSGEDSDAEDVSEGLQNLALTRIVNEVNHTVAEFQRKGRENVDRYLKRSLPFVDEDWPRVHVRRGSVKRYKPMPSPAEPKRWLTPSSQPGSLYTLELRTRAGPKALFYLAYDSNGKLENIYLYDEESEDSLNLETVDPDSPHHANTRTAVTHLRKKFHEESRLNRHSPVSSSLKYQVLRSPRVTEISHYLKIHPLIRHVGSRVLQKTQFGLHPAFVNIALTREYEPGFGDEHNILIAVDYDQDARLGLLTQHEWVHTLVGRWKHLNERLEKKQLEGITEADLAQVERYERIMKKTLNNPRYAGFLRSIKKVPNYAGIEDNPAWQAEEIWGHLSEVFGQFGIELVYNEDHPAGRLSVTFEDLSLLVELGIFPEYLLLPELLNGRRLTDEIDDDYYWRLFKYWVDRGEPYVWRIAGDVVDRDRYSFPNILKRRETTWDRIESVLEQFQKNGLEQINAVLERSFLKEYTARDLRRLNVEKVTQFDPLEDTRPNNDGRFLVPVRRPGSLYVLRLAAPGKPSLSLQLVYNQDGHLEKLYLYDPYLREVEAAAYTNLDIESIEKESFRLSPLVHRLAAYIRSTFEEESRVKSLKQLKPTGLKYQILTSPTVSDMRKVWNTHPLLRHIVGLVARDAVLGLHDGLAYVGAYPSEQEANYAQADDTSVVWEANHPTNPNTAVDLGHELIHVILGVWARMAKTVREARRKRRFVPPDIVDLVDGYERLVRTASKSRRYEALWEWIEGEPIYAFLFKRDQPDAETAEEIVTYMSELLFAMWPKWVKKGDRASITLTADFVDLEELFVRPGLFPDYMISPELVKDSKGKIGADYYDRLVRYWKNNGSISENENPMAVLPGESPPDNKGPPAEVSGSPDAGPSESNRSGGAPGALLTIALALIGAHKILFSPWEAGDVHAASLLAVPDWIMLAGAAVAFILVLRKMGSVLLYTRFSPHPPLSRRERMPVRQEGGGNEMDSVWRVSRVLAERVAADSQSASFPRDKFLELILTALPSMSESLLPPGDSVPDRPEPFLAEELLPILTLSLKANLTPFDHLTEEERRLLAYQTQEDLEALLSRSDGSRSPSMQIRGLVHERLRTVLREERRAAVGMKSSATRSFDLVEQAAAFGFLHEEVLKTQEAAADIKKTEEALGTEKARLFLTLFGQALLTRIDQSPLSPNLSLEGRGRRENDQSGRPSSEDILERLEEAYALGQTVARHDRGVVSSRTMVTVPSDKSLGSDADRLPASSVDVHHVGGFLEIPDDGRFAPMLDRIARRVNEFGRTREDGRPVRGDAFLAEGVAPAEAERLRDALFDRLARHREVQKAPAGTLNRYLDNARFIATEKKRIRPDWLYGALQSAFGLKSFSMNVYTTDAAAFEADPWRNELAWKLYLIVSETEVVDVLKSVEEDLKAIRQLLIQA